jgi:hypothetical protein
VKTDIKRTGVTCRECKQASAVPPVEWVPELNSEQDISCTAPGLSLRRVPHLQRFCAPVKVSIRFVFVAKVTLRTRSIRRLD